MELLTSFDNIHDAEEGLQWLKSHGIACSLEGKNTHALKVFVPGGVGLYILDTSQLREAKRLLNRLGGSRDRPQASKPSLLKRLQKVGLDKMFVAVITAGVSFLFVWLAVKLFQS
jgi:hypothetical protein